jgi:hypothetical protein
MDGDKDDLPQERLVSKVYSPIAGYVTKQDRETRKVLDSSLTVILQQPQRRVLPRYDRRKNRKQLRAGFPSPC